MVGSVKKFEILFTGDARGLVGATRLSASELRKLQRDTRGANSALLRFAGTSGLSRDILQGFGVALGGLGLAKAASGILEVGKNFESMNNAMIAVAGSNEAAAEQFAFIEGQADRLGLALDGATKQYTKMFAAASELDLASADIQNVFLGIAEAGTVLGLSADDMAGALRAVEQGFSKGKIQAEELRGQLGERFPGAVAIMAKALNVTTKELDKMLEQGEVGAEAYVKFADVVREKFAEDVPRAAQSARAETNRFFNTFTRLSREVAEGGVLDAVTDSMRDFNDALSSPEAEAAARALGEAIAFLISSVDELLVLGGAFAAGKILSGPLTLIGASAIASLKGVERFGAGLVVLNTRAAATSLVIGGLNRSMALLGGPVGVAFLAAAGIYEYSKSQIEAADAADPLKQSIEDLTALYETNAEKALEAAGAVKELAKQRVEDSTRKGVNDDPFGTSLTRKQTEASKELIQVQAIEEASLLKVNDAYEAQRVKLEKLNAEKDDTKEKSENFIQALEDEITVLRVRAAQGEVGAAIEQKYLQAKSKGLDVSRQQIAVLIGEREALKESTKERERAVKVTEDFIASNSLELDVGRVRLQQGEAEAEIYRKVREEKEKGNVLTEATIEQQLRMVAANDSAIEAQDKLRDAQDDYVDTLVDLKNELADIGLSELELAKAQVARQIASGELVGSQQELFKVLEQIDAKEKEHKKTLELKEKVQERLNDTIAEYDDLLDAQADALDAIAKAEQDAIVSSEQLRDSWAEEVQLLEVRLTKGKEEAEVQKELNRVRREGLNVTEEEIRAYFKRVAEQEKLIEESEKAAKQYEKIWDNAVQNMQKQFTDTIYGALFEDGIDSFSDFGDAILDIWKKTIAEMISAWLTSGIIGLLSGEGTGGFSLEGLLGDYANGSFSGGTSSGGGGSIGTAVTIAKAGKKAYDAYQAYQAGQTATTVGQAAVTSYTAYTAAQGGAVAAQQGVVGAANAYGGGSAALQGGSSAGAGGFGVAATGLGVFAAITALVDAFVSGTNARKQEARLAEFEGLINDGALDVKQNFEEQFEVIGQTAEGTWIRIEESWREVKDALAANGLDSEFVSQLADGSSVAKIFASGDAIREQIESLNNDLGKIDFGKITGFYDFTEQGARRFQEMTTIVTGDAQQWQNRLQTIVDEAESDTLAGFEIIEVGGGQMAVKLIGHGESWKQALLNVDAETADVSRQLRDLGLIGQQAFEGMITGTNAANDALANFEENGRVYLSNIATQAQKTATAVASIGGNGFVSRNENSGDALPVFHDGGVTARGGLAILDAEEAIIPLKGGNVPVEIRGGNSGASDRMVDLLEEGIRQSQQDAQELRGEMRAMRMTMEEQNDRIALLQEAA